MTFFSQRTMIRVDPVSRVILDYPVLSKNSTPHDRHVLLRSSDESYSANYQVGLGYLFCYGDRGAGVMYLRKAFTMNIDNDLPLDCWCEVAYAFAIAQIANGSVRSGLSELCRIYRQSSSAYTLRDVRLETIRRLPPREIVLRELPEITCPCTVGPCKEIDQVLGCHGVGISLEEARSCCMWCLATVEYLKFRSELYIHCL